MCVKTIDRGKNSLYVLKKNFYSSPYGHEENSLLCGISRYAQLVVYHLYFLLIVVKIKMGGIQLGESLVGIR